MKILTGEQIAQADRFTVENEPVESIDLMERAAEVIAQWVCNNIAPETPLCFFIGKGNNGGDGLAVARILYNAGYNCSVYTVFDKSSLNENCRFNLERLPRGVIPRHVDNVCITDDTVIVDALLGVGVRGEVLEPLRSMIHLINSLNVKVISIDMPSGLPSEMPSGEVRARAGSEAKIETETCTGGRVGAGVATSTGAAATDTAIATATAAALQTGDIVCVNASVTLTLEYPKLSLLLPESGEYAGELVILPIDLDLRYFEKAATPYFFVDSDHVAPLLIPRKKYSHKGSTGHALLVCGIEGMTGAAVLASGGALRSGCGLVTVHLPRKERGVIHSTNPSALVSCDASAVFSRVPENMEKYHAIGVGCGIGQGAPTVKALEGLLEAAGVPVVIDADALNIIANNPEMKKHIPRNSILTPHIGELKRLTGEWKTDAERNEKVMALASALSSFIVVKGAYTMICTPDGRMLFNSTGNPGMAKGGSGDVLTGYITGLLARGYFPEHAAVLGVYIHGKAGDKAAEYYGTEGMNSSDIIDFLGEAMSEIE